MKPLTTLLTTAAGVYAVGVQYGYIKGWRAAIDEVERSRKRGLRKIPKPSSPSPAVEEVRRGGWS